MKKYSIENSLNELGIKNLVKQDNMSTIKTMKGRVRVYVARTRNIHIQYFYATKRVKDGTIVVTYCLIKKMVADYLSKSLQSSLFCLHRNTLMGITSKLADQYQVEYIAAEAAASKLTSDYVSC